MATILKKLPGVLSFQRGMLATDALFYNRFADGRLAPLQVVRHGIRGTQNINKLAMSNSATAASAKRAEVSNIQTTDSAKLDPEAVALEVRFGLRFLALDSALFACAPSQKDKPEDILALRSNLGEFLAAAKVGSGITELACRFARNIANARFLWRNRTVAESVVVRVLQGANVIATFDALDVPLNSFGDYSEGEKAVAAVIAAGLRGDREAKLSVRATVDFGLRGAFEVFPSQNYLEDKQKGFARPLYCVGDVPAGQDEHSVREMGQAALRDQKIGNALRTLDTWYPAYGERGVAIPVEPNGASLDAQEFFRNTKAASGFQLMLQLGTIDPNTDDGTFLLACIVRGGVFSGSDA